MKNEYGFITAESLTRDGSADVADLLQTLINENPNRTIYLPDGVYLLSHTIFTPADPKLSVDLQLSNYATLKASDDWSGGPLVSLGGIYPANDTHTPGSNYSFTGGIVDGSGKADGITIAGGRETAVRRVSIKNTPVGLTIDFGANSGSSDSDISDVNIIGTNTRESIGVIARGYDNTFTNMRIGAVYRGFEVYSSGNILRNIHPLYYGDYVDYEDSCGFYDKGGNNWYDYCYSDQFGTGFIAEGNIKSIFEKCFCFWYSSKGKNLVGFRADGKFNSLVTGFRVDFRGDTENTLLKVREEGGYGVMENLLANPAIFDTAPLEPYLRGTILG
ncbi:MAG: hypothetical protein GX628_05035 [Clostridiales bacterium]|nr:hypothetical protein [Clostridiales bacterium]